MLRGVGVAQAQGLLTVARLQQLLADDQQDRLAQARHAVAEHLVDQAQRVLVQAGGPKGGDELDRFQVGLAEDDVVVGGIGEAERPPQPAQELQRQPGELCELDAGVAGVLAMQYPIQRQQRQALGPCGFLQLF